MFSRLDAIQQKVDGTAVPWDLIIDRIRGSAGALHARNDRMNLKMLFNLIMCLPENYAWSKRLNPAFDKQEHLLKAINAIKAYFAVIYRELENGLSHNTPKHLRENLSGFITELTYAIELTNGKNDTQELYNKCRMRICGYDDYD